MDLVKIDLEPQRPSLPDFLVGLYIVARVNVDGTYLVYLRAASASTHTEVATSLAKEILETGRNRVDFEVLGGGTLTVDRVTKTAALESFSARFGRVSDRELEHELIKHYFVGYTLEDARSK